MDRKNAYIEIDYFRIIAAFLIVANHTSPLAAYSDTADFILTRIVARIAVPFFLMTSGFFLISEYCDSGKIITFLKRTGIIYAIAIVLYLPVNIYSGYFAMDNLLPNIIKDIVFDGTFYHLWYLPASMVGVSIVWLMEKK